MAIERWGALSVADHKDLRGLIANVLLYDRLVMPMYTEADDRDERKYWLDHNWAPDEQLHRRQQLGDLIIECAWDKQRRSHYRSRYEAAQQMDAEVNGEMVSRWLLTENPHYPLPTGVNHADVFVAYNSRYNAEQEMRGQGNAGPNSPDRPALNEEVDWSVLDDDTQVGLLIAHELGVPDIAEPEVALKEAIGLANEQEFRYRRAELYEFQMTCLNRGMSPKAIVAELRDRNSELREYVAKQKVPMRKKTGFMLAHTALGVISGAFGNPVGAIGGLLGLWRFAAFDTKVSLQLPNRLMPVAAFHDIESKLDLKM